MLKKLLLGVMGTIVLVGILLTAMHFYYRGVIFNPTETPPDRIADGFADMVEIELTTQDGLDLAAWYKPANAGRPTVLYLHGNGGNRGDYGPSARPMMAAGLGMMIIDYRGYGGNPGAPTDDGLYLDGEAAYQWLLDQGISADQIILYGYSLGTGVAVHIAAQFDAGAVVLAAPYSSIAEMGYERYPQALVDLMLYDRFDSIQKIGQVREPLLIIHGTNDDIIPERWSARLFTKVTSRLGRRQVIEGASHGWDLFEGGGTDIIFAFLKDSGLLLDTDGPGDSAVAAP